jgi:hypothetical protein
MGVKGLKYFVSRNAQPERLNLTEIASRSQRPIKMLIDGHSFLFFLAGRSSIDFVHGGDHEEFVIYLSQLLHAFNDSSIHLDIIFDGCEIEKKKATIIERMKTRIVEQAAYMNKSSHRKMSKPFICVHVSNHNCFYLSLGTLFKCL